MVRLVSWCARQSEVNMLLIFLNIFVLSVLATNAGVHQRGPHGGYLQTSNNFHLELVLDEKKGALIYLMNKKDQNALIEQASVYFLLKSGIFETNHYCAPIRHHFECRMPHPLSRKPGDEINIRAVRKGLTDHFRYKFPLDIAADPAEAGRVSEQKIK